MSMYDSKVIVLILVVIVFSSFVHYNHLFILIMFVGANVIVYHLKKMIQQKSHVIYIEDVTQSCQIKESANFSTLALITIPFDEPYRFK